MVDDRQMMLYVEFLYVIEQGFFEVGFVEFGLQGYFIKKDFLMNKVRDDVNRVFFWRKLRVIFMVLRGF